MALAILRRLRLGLWFFCSATLALAGGAAAERTAAPEVVAPDAAAAEALYRQALQALAAGQPLLAEQLLRRLMHQHPYFGAAWIELALLYCALGQTERATAMWDDVLQNLRPPAGIEALVQHLRLSPCTPSPSAPEALASGPTTAVTLQLGRGYSSNANQGVAQLEVLLPGPTGDLRLRLQPQAGARADAYQHWLLALQTRPAGADWQALALWQGQWFDSERRYRSQSLALGASGPWHSAAWHGQWLAAAGWSELGGASHQWRLQGQLRAAPAWQPVPGLDWQLETNLAWQHHPQRSALDGLLGSARTSLAGPLGPGLWRAELGLMHESGRGRPGGARTGWLLALHSQQALAPLAGRPLQLQAQWQLQHWLDERVYAPGLIELRREQRLQLASAGLHWQSGAQSAWLLQWQWVRSADNIALLAHRGQSVQLAWQHQWGRSGP